MSSIYDDEPNIFSNLRSKTKFIILKLLEEYPEGRCLKDFYCKTWVS